MLPISPNRLGGIKLATSFFEPSVCHAPSHHHRTHKPVCYPDSRPVMTTLFAISVAAFVALMWASISAARHIRRTRRRRQSVERAAPVFVPSPEAARAAEALAAGHWGRASRPDWKAVEAVTEPPPTPARDSEPVEAKPADVSLLDTTVSPPAAAAVPPPEIRFPLSSQRRASSAAIATAREAASNAAPPPESSEPVRPATSSAAVPAANFQLRRPPASASDSRPDWAYFNKDMGDLRDPEPRFRERPRQR